MKYKSKEKRKYVRLETIFPVEFQLIDDQKKPTSRVFQGFTRNVGKGGMCIESHTEKGKDDLALIPGKTKLKLIINIPSGALATESIAAVRWVDKASEYVLDEYTFGVQYDEIESDNQKMIERHVAWLYRKPKLVLLFVVILVLFTIVLTFFGIQAR